ncbi:hypothetical protein DFH09DRAFT_1069437 [Mycena vulgaris]|nr:hypothetical protein DFH09DRAFT_1069437 [Mycena vulgaris]
MCDVRGMYEGAREREGGGRAGTGGTVRGSGGEAGTGGRRGQVRRVGWRREGGGTGVRREGAAEKRERGRGRVRRGRVAAGRWREGGRAGPGYGSRERGTARESGVRLEGAAGTGRQVAAGMRRGGGGNEVDEGNAGTRRQDGQNGDAAGWGRVQMREENRDEARYGRGGGGGYGTEVKERGMRQGMRAGHEAGTGRSGTEYEMRAKVGIGGVMVMEDEGLRRRGKKKEEEEGRQSGKGRNARLREVGCMRWLSAQARRGLRDCGRDFGEIEEPEEAPHFSSRLLRSAVWPVVAMNVARSVVDRLSMEKSARSRQTERPAGAKHATTKLTVTLPPSGIISAIFGEWRLFLTLAVADSMKFQQTVEAVLGKI